MRVLRGEANNEYSFRKAVHEGRVSVRVEDAGVVIQFDGHTAMPIPDVPVHLVLLQGIGPAGDEYGRAEIEISVIRDFGDLSVDAGELAGGSRLLDRYENDWPEAIAIAEMNRFLRVDFDDERNVL